MPFRDAGALSEAVKVTSPARYNSTLIATYSLSRSAWWRLAQALLGDDELLAGYNARAHASAASMSWPHVGAQFIGVAMTMA